MAEQIIPRDFYVYTHHKSTTGEIFYVGKGCKKRAWSVDGRNAYWKRVANKYGVHVRIVCDGLQEWAAFELECNLIDYYGRKDLGYGGLVNADDGGRGSANPGIEALAKRSKSLRLAFKKPSEKERRSACMKKRWESADTKEAASERMKKRMLDETFRAIAIGKLMEVNKNPEFISRQSDRLRAMQSDPVFKAKVIAAIKKTKSTPVLCVETGETFYSISEAARWVSTNTDYKLAVTEGIRSSAKGKCDYAYGFTWEFVDPDRRDVAKKLRMSRYERLTEITKSKSRPIRMVSTGEKFDSANDAARYLTTALGKKITSGNICSSANGNGKRAYGSYWEWA